MLKEELEELEELEDLEEEEDFLVHMSNVRYSEDTWLSALFV